MIDSSDLLAGIDECVTEAHTHEPKKEHCRQPNNEIHSDNLQ
jgi:hypothetical protein